MPKTSGAIPNLINGISQQSPAMRLPSQAEASENYYPTVTDGLIKRPRTDHKQILAQLPANTFTHFILRDEVEKYVVAFLTNGTIRVWDMLTGQEKTVTNNGASYLTGITNAKEDIEALTVADHTFIINKRKVVAQGAANEPTRPYEALVSVAAGNYDRVYRVFVNGELKSYYHVPNGGEATDALYADTTRLASKLFQGLAGVDDSEANPANTEGLSGTWTFGATGARGYEWGGRGGLNTAPWTVGRYNSTLYIRNTSADFALATEDGFNGRAMIAVKGFVQRFSDLPLHGQEGFVVEVKGTDATAFDNYWVKFTKQNTNSEFGAWVECVKPGAKLGLNAATMPHTLVRNSDGTFTFGPATWINRKCGDEIRNPDPSFVGTTIREVFFHKNRLGFLTPDNIVMSQEGDFFNFYRATLTALLDTDPIDTAASDVKVTNLQHAVIFQKELLAFSKNTQFSVVGNQIMSPKTVSGDALTRLTSSPRVRPEAAASNIYFISEREKWATLYEYFIDKALETADYDDVGAHAPNYIPSGVHKLIVSPDLDLALLATDGDPNAIYAYKFYWNGQEKLQSAWQRWRYPGVEAVVNMAFEDGNVWLLVRRNGWLMLERFTAEQAITDTGLNYVVYLDRNVVIPGGTYSSGTGKTTFTLPYHVSADIMCVTAPGGPLPAGVELTPTIPAGDTFTLTFNGNYASQPVRFGLPYESRHRLSEFFQRNAQNIVDEDGRLQVHYLSLSYTKSAYFRVEVTTEGRETRVYPFSGRVIGSAENQVGVLAIDNGRVSIPIMSRADRVVIELVNDTWKPSSFVSAKWRGIWNPNSRQQ